MPSLIARTRELGDLSAALQRAFRGEMQIVFVSGEAGIGKTMLITTFIEMVKRKVPKIFVSGSACYSIAGGQQDVYLPFAQVLESIVRIDTGNTLREKVLRGIAEVAPDWISVVPVVGDVAAATIRTAKWVHKEFGPRGSGIDTSKLMVQYTNALRLAAEINPLLLWIDDLQWCDYASLDLLAFLADHARDSRIMIAIAYRPSDIAYEVQGQAHPAKRLIERLQRYQQCVEISLRSFSRTDLEAFLLAGGYRFSQRFKNRLLRQSGGNPLFLKEYITLLRQKQLLKQEDDGFVLVQEDVQIEVPSTLNAVIEQRLGLIGIELQRLLSYASVQGERFMARVLAEIFRAPELDVLEWLSLLDRIHRLINELEAGHLIIKVGAEYQFVHVLIQQVLYNRLSVGQRRQLHLAIGQMLESIYGDDVLKYAADLAIHFERGGDLTHAIDYYLHATRNALGAMAFQDALQQAQSARALAHALSRDEHSVVWHIKILRYIAEINVWCADYHAALAACDEGEALCAEGGFDEDCAELLYWRSEALFAMGRYGLVVEPVERALKLLGDSLSNPRLKGFLYARKGQMSSVLPISAILSAIDSAIEIANRHDLPDVKVRALMHRAHMMTGREDQPSDALRVASEALTIAEHHGLVFEQCSSHHRLSRAYLALQRGSEALTHAQSAVTIARKYGLVHELHRSLRLLATTYREVLEDWQMALETVREAIALAEKYEFPVNRSVIGVWFETAFGLGLWNEAEQALSRLQERVESSYHVSKAELLVRRGQLAFARRQFEEAAADLETALSIYNAHSPSPREARSIQPILGLALVAIGNTAAAVQNLEQAIVYWQDRQNTRLLGQSLQGLAYADLATQQSDQAVIRLREALRICKGSFNSETDSWPVWQEICVDLGRALLQIGKTDEALQYALSGYAAFKRSGHFMLGEAAFWVGQILIAQGKRNQALPYLNEALMLWQLLGLPQSRFHQDSFTDHSGI